MKNPSQPDTQPDEYLPEAKGAHKDRRMDADREGINPRDTSSMPRGEDDEKTRADSPEFHDRTDVPDAGTATLPRAPR
ncbi:MAG TPA: hypothetical protein VNT81_01650 [Vicinamibacterales bacterium]|nr:hypothetical protein [Vicinamibacterales bacterium]